MEYKLVFGRVTLVSGVAGDHQVSMAVTGPEESLESQVMGLVYLVILALL